MTRNDNFKSDREMTVCELQNDVARYEVEYIKARNDLRQALREVTNEALYGVVAKTPDISAVVAPNVKPGGPAPRSPNASLGRIYCDFTARVKKTTARIASALVPSLYAAQSVPPQNPAVIPTPQPTPAVVVPAGTQDSATVAITQAAPPTTPRLNQIDRKSTRLNSSHSQISYAVFCL